MPVKSLYMCHSPSRPRHSLVTTAPIPVDWAVGISPGAHQSLPNKYIHGPCSAPSLSLRVFQAFFPGWNFHISLSAFSFISCLARAHIWQFFSCFLLHCPILRTIPPEWGKDIGIWLIPNYLVNTKEGREVEWNATLKWQSLLVK